MTRSIASALGRPSYGAAVDEHPVAGRGDAGVRRVGLPGVEDDADRQAEGAREVEVALVVRGHGHDGAGAVVGQHVVGGVDRHRLAGQRVGRGDAEVDAGLGPVGQLPVEVGELAHLVAVGLQRRALLRRAQLLGQRGIRSHHEEGGAVEGVRPRGEDGHRATGDGEVDVRAPRPADPVLLHEQDALGPLALERAHVLEQPVGVVGDLEVPLGQLALGDLGAAALAPATDDLLVGEHGLVLRAPVDRAVAPVGQAPLAQPQEQPLRPPVVLRVAGVQPLRPVEADGVAAERLRLRLDVLVGPGGRVLVALDGGVLRRQPEGVPADRVQHVVAAAHPVARHDVTDAERLGVPHVQVAARVAEHVEHVLLGRAVAQPGAVEVEPVPDRQPALLHRLRLVDLVLCVRVVAHVVPRPRPAPGLEKEEAPVVTRAPH